MARKISDMISSAKHTTGARQISDQQLKAAQIQMAKKAKM